MHTHKKSKYSLFGFHFHTVAILIDRVFCISSRIKCPARDACLYLGERGERVGPPAPPFSITYSSATTWWILFKFST